MVGSRGFNNLELTAQVFDLMIQQLKKRYNGFHLCLLCPTYGNKFYSEIIPKMATRPSLDSCFLVETPPFDQCDIIGEYKPNALLAFPQGDAPLTNQCIEQFGSRVDKKSIYESVNYSL